MGSSRRDLDSTDIAAKRLAVGALANLDRIISQ